MRARLLTDPMTFCRAVVRFRARDQRGYFLATPVDCGTFEGHRLYLSADQLTGVAVSPEGELHSLFNAGPRGRGAEAVEWALANGADHLNCFVPAEGGGLADFYSRFGFVVTSTYPFDPALVDDARQAAELGDGWVVVDMALQSDRTLTEAA